MSSRKRFAPEELEAIFDRTSGKCHICHHRLAFSNYGNFGGRGAWEVEHSRPRARGGTDHGNNLYAAHIECNRAKGKRCTRTARSWNGVTKAPLSSDKRAEWKGENSLAGGALGALVGAALAGPPGAILMGLLGAAWGKDQDPDSVS